MIIHFVFLYLGLMILILLLDIAQHFLKSVLWALILMCIYILFFIFFIEVSEVSFFSLMTLQANSVIVFKIDRKSTRLNSSHVAISYAVFCLKKKKKKIYRTL